MDKIFYLIFYVLILLLDPKMSFLALSLSSTRPSLGSDTAFCHHVDLMSFNLEHFHSHFLIISIYFKNTALPFLGGICSMSPHD